MSDIQTLIHKSSMHAYDQGVSRERLRIIKLLEDSMAICDKNKEPEGCEACYGQRDAIALIKGEQK